MTTSNNTNIGKKHHKRRLIFILSLLLIAGFMATSLISYFVSRSSVRQQIITNELPLTSDNIYSEIQRDILPSIFISSLMANDSFLRNWVIDGEKDNEKITQYLSEIMDKYNTFTSFFVSDKTRTYYHAKGILKKVSPDAERDIWYFRVRKMKQNYEINVDPNQADKDKMTIFVNHKVFDFNGSYIGATGVGLEISQVKSLIETYHKKYHRTIYFVAPDGKIVLYSASCKPGKNDNIKQNEIAPVADKILSNPSCQLRYYKNGSNIYVNTRYIPELNWFLIVEQSDSHAVKSIFHTLVLNLTLCGLVTIIVITIMTVTLNTYQRKFETFVKTDLELKNINSYQREEIEQQHRELLDKNEKLTRLNASKNKLFSIIAHDLRTPVGNTTLLLQLLEDACQKGSKEDIDDLMMKLKETSESAFVLLENLFEWAKKQISEIDCSPEEFNVHDIMKDSIAINQLSADKKKIAVKFDCDRSLTAFADTNMIKTITRNLLSNAIKFTPSNGTVQISAAPVEGKVIVSIKDTGVGIEPEKIPLLFDFTNNITTFGTDGEKGTGLGLSLCHDLISLNHGKIQVKSTPGEGSIFSFTIPLRQG